MAANWTRLECEAIVDDYLSMLALECRQESYSKTEFRRSLIPKLNNRSDGSIEYKHQNISAILLQAGHIYIAGYKPAWNYQSLLEDVVLSRLAATETAFDQNEQLLIDQIPEGIEVRDWEKVFVPPPERLPIVGVREERVRRPRVIDFAAREARNRALGERGEAFVMELEQMRLRRIGRDDLLTDVEWTSKEKGDGAGYDIRSFLGATDEPLYIEVKTTNSGKYQPFMISPNEVGFSNEQADRYSLYRVFNFRSAAAVFELKGAVGSHVDLEPSQFRASFR